MRRPTLMHRQCSIRTLFSVVASAALLFALITWTYKQTIRNSLFVQAIQLARAGDFQGVEKFLSHGGNVNSRTEFGETIAYYAVCYEDGEALRYLISKGAKVRLTPQGAEDAILTAINCGNTELVKVLLQTGEWDDACKILLNHYLYRASLMKDGSESTILRFIESSKSEDSQSKKD